MFGVGKRCIQAYALKLGKYDKPVLDQKTIEQAAQVFDQLARPAIAVQMNKEGAEIWERLTESAFQERFQIAMVINDTVYSAPRVSQGPIKGGKFEISSDFTVEEAQDLAIILDSGSISKMHIISFDVAQIN
ncbi:hypothetical protein [Aquimarina sp. I32.4]|uniref:SecDF P1 head subdomain-containing protein n=1 Tax=Aquimarina sp. I32.4 TaxID=2053903 RepID=UPI000CDEE814|nr:hypothetical protein [Aquimarina sp. I32.4]